MPVPFWKTTIYKYFSSNSSKGSHLDIWILPRHIMSFRVHFSKAPFDSNPRTRKRPKPAFWYTLPYRIAYADWTYTWNIYLISTIQISLNNIEVSIECVETLEKNLSREVQANLGGILLRRDQEKLQSCLTGLTTTTKRFRSLSEFGYEQLKSSAIKPRIKPWVDYFLSVSHDINEVFFVIFFYDLFSKLKLKLLSPFFFRKNSVVMKFNILLSSSWFAIWMGSWADLKIHWCLIITRH